MIYLSGYQFIFLDTCFWLLIKKRILLSSWIFHPKLSLVSSICAAKKSGLYALFVWYRCPEKSSSVIDQSLYWIKASYSYLHAHISYINIIAVRHNINMKRILAILQRLKGKRKIKTHSHMSVARKPCGTQMCYLQELLTCRFQPLISLQPLGRFLSN